VRTRPAGDQEVAVSELAPPGHSATHPRTSDVWGDRTPFASGQTWPARVDQCLEPGVSEGDVDRWVQSACLLCSNGCGVDIAVSDGRMVGVRGREHDRVNRGRLGPKGLLGWQGQNRDRLTRPLVRRDGRLRECSWDEAMGVVVERSRALLDDRGPLTHGFYTSGQLMLEEYYTLAVLGKAGLGTPHMDGNTRLCTATAAAALKETFGTDGQPGSYDDIDHCDALFLFGHNVAETQTVLWARILDRLDGPDPPRLVCVDPRRTPVAERATVHLSVRPGTNQALMNGLLREVLHRGWVDREYIEQHTQGLDILRTTVDPYTPELVSEICGVAADDVRAAAAVFGNATRVLSTVLQGFYQSHQATAAAVQVNNLHLLRGMLGRPGAGVLQMNGQPTAQNNRECGADGDLPGFRNWDNEEHVAELAEMWDVDRIVIPHWAPPTHAMQLFRYAEQGSLNLLWIAGTNPAVSMPDLDRVRRILRSDDVLVVANDAYRTETTELADVVLPAALWGEKTGTYTNADRTVHLSEQAVDPPGEARSDLTIWVDYARRMGLTDRSGRPIPRWDTPEAAFDAWRECSRGRPCDYSGLSYATLRGSPGVQWPCNESAPRGTERLYTDGRFNTDTGQVENYGHDLQTGATVSQLEHSALRLDGRAQLKAAPWTPGPAQTDDDYPMLLTTGRTAYHFHTRTKTGRVQALADAAPCAWAQVSADDASRLGVRGGDRVRLESPQGALEVIADVGDIPPGTVFVPFHYGNLVDPAGPTQAANELTMTVWDPVSKQPLFKHTAVRVVPVDAGR
jgi:ferredoxin-nitrate reductase